MLVRQTGHIAVVTRCTAISISVSMHLIQAQCPHGIRPELLSALKQTGQRLVADDAVAADDDDDGAALPVDVAAAAAVVVDDVVGIEAAAARRDGRSRRLRLVELL